MKKISLSILALLLAGSTVFANGTDTKKTKRECHKCAKGKCTKDGNAKRPTQSAPTKLSALKIAK